MRHRSTIAWVAASIAVAIGVSSCALKPVDAPKQLRQQAATASLQRIGERFIQLEQSSGQVLGAKLLWDYLTFSSNSPKPPLAHVLCTLSF